MHFVFIPRINKNLIDFQGAWNQHTLSTEGNMSPLQLFVEGATIRAMGEEEPDIQQLELSPNPTVQDTPDAVQVPANKFIPCSVLTSLLQASVDPMTQSTDCGRSLYCTTVQTVGQHLQAGCVQCKLE